MNENRTLYASFKKKNEHIPVDQDTASRCARTVNESKCILEHLKDVNTWVIDYLDVLVLDVLNDPK